MPVNRTRALSLTTVAILGGVAATTAEALVDRTWDGPTSGEQSWNTAANWSDDDVPNDGFWYLAQGEKAIIGDTTADRNITTPATAPNAYFEVSAFDFSQSASGTGINKVTLGGNLYVTGPGYGTYSTADASKLVVDLNGHQMNGYVVTNLQGTFRDSSTGGGGVIDTIYAMGFGANSVVESSVLVISRGAYYGNGPNTWSTGTKIIMADAHTQYGGGTDFWDVDFGTASSATQGGWFNNVFDMTARNDLTVYAPTNANPFQLAGKTIAVGGDFVDHATSAGASYDPGTIAFFGSPTSPRTVHIERNLVGVNVRVGDNGPDGGGSTGATAGDVVLDTDLSTTGNVLVRGSSKLDVAGNTLSAGTFTGDNGMRLGLSFGDGGTGLVNVTGNLSLSDFTLDLALLGDWAGGDLTLFSYGGTLGGTPNLLLGETPAGFEYDAFVAGDGVVMLTNVVVPEPAAATIVALGGLLLMRRRR